MFFEERNDSFADVNLRRVYTHAGVHSALPVYLHYFSLAAIFSMILQFACAL
jgi:hypothetical protein